MGGLQKEIEKFIQDPYDAENNMFLASEYEKVNHVASAISHYMRGAEYGLDSSSNDRDLIISTSLLKAAENFSKLGSRIHSIKTLILHAISVTPDLPQAYLELSKVHESKQEWLECNTACVIGIANINKFRKLSPFEKRTKNEILIYLTYNFAISSYHIGKTDQARLELAKLYRNKSIPDWIRVAIENSFAAIGQPVKYQQLTYNNRNKLKWGFRSYGESSFSQCMQDVFVSSLLGHSGTYLEICSGDPIKHNNTYLLERDYGWTGFSIDYDCGLVEKFRTTRTNPVMCADARQVDYVKELDTYNMPDVIDYLQIDCEPPQVSLDTLYKVPFDKYKFKIITFEHDGYRDPKVREESRKFLKKLGYKLVISDISFNGKDVFEDWWYNPKIADFNVGDVINVSNKPKSVIDLFLEI